MYHLLVGTKSTGGEEQGESTTKTEDKGKNVAPVFDQSLTF